MAGYTRQEAANIMTGEVVQASHLNNELNQVLAAFSASTGHDHGGSAGEGKPVTKVGPAQEYISSGSAFYPKTDATYNLGTLSLQWNDSFFKGAMTFAGSGVSAIITPGGTTAQRPGSPVARQMYFDTTLGYPIWYDGSDWVDATGTAV